MGRRWAIDWERMGGEIDAMMVTGELRGPGRGGGLQWDLGSSLYIHCPVVHMIRSELSRVGSGGSNSHRL